MGVITLPIPVDAESKTYRELETRKLRGGVIADTKKAVDAGTPYRAIQTFIAGHTERIGDITERANINSIIGYMPYKTAEYVALKILIEDEPDDGIEGYYICPRCGTPKVCEDKNGVDTRDFVSDLDLNIAEDNPVVTVTVEPIEIPSDETLTVTSVEMKYPTLNNCVAAAAKTGDKDEIRLQYAIYSEALTKINGAPINRGWRSRYGMGLFERIGRDHKKIASEINRYGLNRDVIKICQRCDKKWKVAIDTANFFVLGLAGGR